MKAEILERKTGGISDQPVVFIELEAIRKIFSFATLSPGEITGWGNVERKGNHFRISEVFILKQRARKDRVDEDPLALNEYLGNCLDPSKIKFQWHSHGDLPVFFSSQDREIVKGYSTDFLISMVVNRRCDYLCRLDIFRPFELSIKVPLFVILPIQKEVIEFCQKEVKEKVKIGLIFKARNIFNKEEAEALKEIILPIEEVMKK